MEPAAAPGRFNTTRWSLVLAAGRGSSPGANEALATLCEVYWYPLYAHARRRGLSTDEAQDRTQGCFARLLEKRDLAVLDQTRGRFRSWLLASFEHFLSNERDRERAEIRGGGRAFLSLDFESGESRFCAEPTHAATPERLYDRQWALALLDRALGRLRDEYQRTGKAEVFDFLKPALAGDRSSPYCEVAAHLGMNEATVKVAVHRMRVRCREFVRDEIAQTVVSDEEVDDELRHLFDVLGS